MTGMSSLSSYERSGYRISGISFGDRGMTVHTVKKGASPKLKPMYNYKILSAAILSAKTPNEAAQAAIKARQKLGELLRGSGSGEDSDADLRAAIIHVRKMEMIAKRKKKHPEQEEMAERGQATPGEDQEKAENVLNGTGGSSEKKAEKEQEEEEVRLAGEIEQMELEMNLKLINLSEICIIEAQHGKGGNKNGWKEFDYLFQQSG